jgi:autotransporter-associated beta strand protein
MLQKTTKFINNKNDMKALLLLLTLTAITCKFSAGQTTVNYTIQTGNFNSLLTEKNNNPPYAGTYNHSVTEIAQYANGGSFGNTPGAAAFQTFTTGGAGSGTARTLAVGDRFTVTCYVGANPSVGGYIGISFRASTTYTNFFSATDAATVARFQLDNTGNWKVYSCSTVAATSSVGPTADRTFSIEVTSSNTFNATIGSETFYDIPFGVTGPISSFAIYTYGDANQNSYWKNGSLINFGHSSGDGIRLGYGLSGSSSSNITGIISDGINTNSTSTSLTNILRIGGNSGTAVTLNAANTFTGQTTVNANASVKLGVSSTTSASGPLGTTAGGTTVSSGGVLDLNGNSLSGSATEALTLNGDGISHGGALINSSSNPSVYIGAITLGTGSRLNATVGNITLSGNISGGSNSLYVGGSNNTSISGIISGAGGGTDGSVFKDGSGTLKLSGTNDYTGQTQINNGELWIESSGSISASSAIYLGNGGLMANVAKLWLSNSTGGTTFSNNVTVNPGNTTTRYLGGLNNSGTHTFSGDITNNSTNGLHLSALNSYFRH